MTIIVSCSPAVSAFWINSEVKSACYSKLSKFGSILVSLRISRSRTAKDKNSAYSQGQQPFRSNIRLNDSRGYYGLQDGAYNQPITRIHSSEKIRDSPQRTVPLTEFRLATSPFPILNRCINYSSTVSILPYLFTYTTLLILFTFRLN